MFKEGLIPRKENVPWTIDAQYVPGFDWLRNPEVRIVKDFDKVVWLGVEAASPQGFGNRGEIQPDSRINTFPCTSQLDPSANCALDFMPDFTAKMAVDPGWGHYEIFGLARGFRDRISNPQGAALRSLKSKKRIRFLWRWRSNPADLGRQAAIAGERTIRAGNWPL